MKKVVYKGGGAKGGRRYVVGEEKEKERKVEVDSVSFDMESEVCSDSDRIMRVAKLIQAT